MTEKQIQQQVKRKSSDGESIRSIAKELRLSRYKVSAILQQVETSPNQTAERFLQLHPIREEIHDWHLNHKLTARLIHKRLLSRQIDISYSTVVRYLKTLSKKEVYVPVISEPGEEAQVDFGYFGLFNKEGKKVKVWVFNMVLSFSRYAFYKIVTDQSIATFLDCHTAAFEFFKGVPASIKIDNLRAGVLEADFYEPVLQKKYADFLAWYTTTAVTARVCRGQDKGKVEAGIKYVKNNFLPAVSHGDYTRLADDLANWISTECNLRIHGVTKKIPQEQYLKLEKKTLLPLPEQRYSCLQTEERKVNPYGHIYFRKNYYSVPHHYSGSLVQVQSNGSTLQVFDADKLIAVHAICASTGRFITVEEHKPFHKRLKTEAYYVEKAEQIGEHTLRFLQLLQVEKPFHWKTMMRAVFALKKLYNNTLLNNACQAAILSGNHSCKKVRWYCESYFQKPGEKQRTIKGTNGYYHELSIYDQLVNT